MTHTLTLVFKIHEFWQSGSGQGSPGYVDMAAMRDAEGLPYLPGRTVKGLLRDACFQLDELVHQKPTPGHNDVAAIFGEADAAQTGGSNQGRIRCSDARMPEADRAFFRHEDNNAAKVFLFTTLQSTAMANGINKDKSLRIREAALPMELTATLSSSREEDLRRIETALPLIRQLGSNRHRGLGRCSVYVHPNS